MRMSAGSTGRTMSSVPGGSPGSMELVSTVSGTDLVIAGTTITAKPSATTRISSAALMVSFR